MRRFSAGRTAIIPRTPSRKLLLTTASIVAITLVGAGARHPLAAHANPPGPTTFDGLAAAVDSDVSLAQIAAKAATFHAGQARTESSQELDYAKNALAAAQACDKKHFSDWYGLYETAWFQSQTERGRANYWIDQMHNDEGDADSNVNTMTQWQRTPAEQALTSQEATKAGNLHTDDAQVEMDVEDDLITASEFDADAGDVLQQAFDALALCDQGGTTGSDPGNGGSTTPPTPPSGNDQPPANSGPSSAPGATPNGTTPNGSSGNDSTPAGGQGGTAVLPGTPSTGSSTTAANTPPAPQKTFAVSPTSVTAGATVSFDATGLPAGQQAQIVFGSLVLATVRAAPDGSVAGTFLVPPSTLPGAHTVTLATTNGGSQTATLIVLPGGGAPAMGGGAPQSAPNQPSNHQPYD